MNYSSENGFLEAVKRHSQGIIEGNTQIANDAYAMVVSYAKDLRKSPDRGEEFLTSLLNDEDLSVVRAAATYLLPLREVEAVQALEEVAKDGPPLIAFGAEMTLKEWQAGRLSVD